MKLKQKLKIGLIYQGNGTNDIWGCYITTYYLQKAFQELGHEVWRFSVTYDQMPADNSFDNTDLMIVEGTPTWLIPRDLWFCAKFHAFWWLSDLYYNKETVTESIFDGVATNSKLDFEVIEKKIPSAIINLAVDKDFCAGIQKNDLYDENVTYLGLFPHKSEDQMDFLFTPASKFNLSLWGRGWEKSKYAKFAKGILPISHINQLYSQSRAALLITEKRQMARGMINNRAFEVLGCGCLAISESYPEMEQSDIGKFVKFFSTPKAVEEYLYYTDLLSDKVQIENKQAQQYLMKHHTYTNRAHEFIALYEQWLGVN